MYLFQDPEEDGQNLISPEILLIAPVKSFVTGHTVLLKRIIIRDF